MNWSVNFFYLTIIHKIFYVLFSQWWFINAIMWNKIDSFKFTKIFYVDVCASTMEMLDVFDDLISSDDITKLSLLCNIYIDYILIKIDKC